MPNPEYFQKRRKERRLKYLKLLGGKCEECGSKKNLEFDHIDPSKKEFGISRYLNYADDRLMEEVKKCRLLCQDCHKKKTHKEWDYAQPESPHGSLRRYQTYGCRCDKCKQARKDYYLSRKKSSISTNLIALGESSDVINWANNRLPSFIEQYIVEPKQLKDCQGISSKIVAMARRDGFEAYVIHEPGHFVACIISNRKVYRIIIFN